MTKARKIICIIMLCLIVVLGLVGYGIYISYHNLTVNEYTLESEKLDETVTFAVIADLHDYEFGEDNQELVAQIATLDVDAIFMVGDFVNRYSEHAEVLLTCAGQLMDVAPVYFTWGNHELEYVKAQGQSTDTLEQTLTGLGVVVLDQAWQDVEIAGQNIRIGGLYDYAFALDGWNSCDPEAMEPEVYQFLSQYHEAPFAQNTADTDDIFKIMLSHRPETFVLGAASKTWDVDLVVSGHVHGGQVVLPFWGGLWAGDQGWFPEYDHGMYEKDLIHIFITNGLGSSNKFVPRFNNPPEIAVLKIVPKNNEKP